jgi:hypothetical protein
MPPPKKKKKPAFKVEIGEATDLVSVPGVEAEPDPETDAVEIDASTMDPGWQVELGEAQLGPQVRAEVGDVVMKPQVRAEVGEAVMAPQMQVDVGDAMELPSRYNNFGALVPGNIDLSRRPHVMNADGSHSTVRSMGINPGDAGGNEVLIPTVSDDGHIMTNEDAILKYELSGRHLGEYPSVEASNAAAEAIHQDQMRNMPADTLDPAMSRTVPFQGIPSAGRYTSMFAKGSR